MSTNIRNANLGDLNSIKKLYLDITEKYPDNLTPFTSEVTDEFIREGLQAALERGAALVMESEENEIIGYGKGYTSKNIRKAHIFDHTTVMIRSDYMNSMSAYRFCRSLTNFVQETMPYIKYTCSMPHAVNARSLRLLQSIGMKQIGTQPNAIMCKDGLFVDEVTLIWENPGFSYASLIAYHQYLLEKYSSTSTTSQKSIMYQTYKINDARLVNTPLNNSINLSAIAV